MSSCLSVKPLEMQQCLEGKCQELLKHCWGELWGKDPQKQAALEELEQGLDRLMAQFLPGYEQRFKMAEMKAETEANKKAVEDARQAHKQFVQKQDRDHQSMSCCLSVEPAEMQQRLEGKQQELLKHFQWELLGEDPQTQATLGKLKKELDRQMAQFLTAYGKRFKGNTYKHPEENLPQILYSVQDNHKYCKAIPGFSGPFFSGDVAEFGVTGPFPEDNMAYGFSGSSGFSGSFISEDMASSEFRESISPEDG
ncbi:uncharacterized protein LOC122460547 [Dermochelys coriacea]|uniref:uncharacterized protein LOC122460547 n=1 Tax=Dermochelys coriacea TaxID=27794 RepID=UPI001CA9561C|nr:uncharacterized protein LOC122460547 [Dermochelys coriacea]